MICGTHSYFAWKHTLEQEEKQKMASLKSIASDVEGVETKVVSFVAKEIMIAENFLGAKTGNAKLNLVVTAVEAGLTAVGINVSNVEAEVEAVVNTLVALFNKAGLLPTSAATPVAPLK